MATFRVAPPDVQQYRGLTTLFRAAPCLTRYVPDAAPPDTHSGRTSLVRSEAI